MPISHSGYSLDIGSRTLEIVHIARQHEFAKRLYCIDPDQDSINTGINIYNLSDEERARIKPITLQQLSENLKNNHPEYSNWPRQFEYISIYKFNVNIAEKKPFIEALQKLASKVAYIKITFGTPAEQKLYNDEHGWNLKQELEKIFETVTFSRSGDLIARRVSKVTKEQKKDTMHTDRLNAQKDKEGCSLL